MAEPLVALLVERWNFSRRWSAFWVGCLAWALGLFSVLSFNVWSTVKIADRWGVFQVLTDLPLNLLLPIGALLFCLFAGWIMDQQSVKEEFGSEHSLIYSLFRSLIRYIAPMGILIVMIAGLIH